MKLLKILVSIIMLTSSYVYAQKIVLEDIVSVPDVDRVTMSPDGEHIAYTFRVNTPTNQGVYIVTYNTKTGKNKKLVYSANEKYVVTDILWGNNDIIILKAKFPAMRSGTPTTETRLLKIDIHTTEITGVIPNRILKKMRYMPNILSNIIDILPDDDDHILMSIAGFSNSSSESVVKIALTEKGKSTTIKTSEQYVYNWLTDSRHDVRIGIYRKDTQYKIYEIDAEGELKELWQFEAFSHNKIWPIGFGTDPDILYIRALYNGKNAIYTVNLKDPNLTKELIYFNENYDINGQVHRSKETKEYIGVGSYYWDKNYRKFRKSINKALPDTRNRIIDISDDGNKYIILSSNDNEPGIYYIGDRKNKTLGVFSYRYEKLAPDVLSKKKHISYKARDGLTIEGYLTLPRNTANKNLPTIIFPHGGPISKTHSGFDYWTQFFANKGYAVLQMNFRGSSGYGFDFMKQGIASWGQAMQDDVEDGTRWLIKEGIADKNKVCIVGASYGGYAALMGAIKSPDLYQCVVSFAGVTNVESLVKAHRNFTNYDLVKKQVGDDFNQLWDVSPLKHVEKINVPVLLIHGTKDRVVRFSQSDDMFDELEGEDKKVTFVPIEMADHYLSNNEHRLIAFKAIDKFLDINLPVSSTNL